MFKWVTKIAQRLRRDPDRGLAVCEYGQYVHKPVMQRALAMVSGLTQTEFVRLVSHEDVYLNGDKLDVTHLVLRMESGTYRLKIPSLGKVWTFFIA